MEHTLKCVYFTEWIENETILWKILYFSTNLTFFFGFYIFHTFFVKCKKIILLVKCQFRFRSSHFSFITQNSANFFILLLVSSDSLWSRVSEMVSAFNGELQMQKHNRKMKPDSVPVGVDCTLSPVIPVAVTTSATRSEFVTTITPAESPTLSPVKRVVCSPDLPVYPLVSTTQPPADDTIVDSSTQTPSIQGSYLIL